MRYLLKILFPRSKLRFILQTAASFPILAFGLVKLFGPSEALVWVFVVPLIAYSFVASIAIYDQPPDIRKSKLDKLHGRAFKTALAVSGPTHEPKNIPTGDEVKDRDGNPDAPDREQAHSIECGTVPEVIERPKMIDRIDLTQDHAGLTDDLAARRYFAKFERITGHLGRVAAEMQVERTFSKTDVTIIRDYVQQIASTFRALSHKYLLTGRDGGLGFGSLNIDRVDSGFPVFSELMRMANDAQQAARHLGGMRTATELKDEMIRQIVGDLSVPVKLQYALSQRLYYEELQKGELFWATNDPQAIWTGNDGPRRSYLVHWAVYDSQQNVPTIYLMDVEDTGDTALPKDARRWPAAQAHLVAQASAGLKLLTIAQGFDRDFDDLHPKRLRRIHVGPMYSHTFTRQSGPIREVLEQAQGGPGEDWTLAWTVEDLRSERVELEKKGWFGQVEREIFRLDPFAARGAETGATSIMRAVILPQRPYQVLAEKRPAGFANIRKFVVSPAGRVVSYR